MLKTSNFCTLTHRQRVLLLLRCTSDAERRGSQTALFSLTLEAPEAECQVTKGAHDWSWAKNRAPLTLTVPPSARFSRVRDYNSYRESLKIEPEGPDIHENQKHRRINSNSVHVRAHSLCRQ